MPRNALMDFLQSASNEAAGAVSGPVDLLSWGLRKAGVPVPQNALLSSEWMAQRGLTRPVQPGAAQVVGATAGLLSPVVAAAKAPQIARGLLQAGENALAPRTLNPQLGAIVYHGSPHKFDAFDSSKIGTGEGAQAYGHGLYLAENPNVAQEYAGALSAARANRQVGNVDLQQVYQSLPNDVPETLLAARRDFRALNDAGELSRADRRDFLDAVKGNITAAKGGALYKVDLPDPVIARMLDWDKPLSQQAPEVRRFFEPTVAPIRAEMAKPANLGWGDLAAPTNFDPTGEELLGLLRNRDAELTAQSFLGNGLGRDVSSTLRQQGIPGIRYLDGSSRGAGAGTSNFVVFPGEENALRIIERNGKPLR